MASVAFDGKTGINLPTTREIRNDLATKIQQALRTNPNDPDVNVDSTSPLGQVIDLITAEIEAKNAEIAYLASQYSPRQATGVWLDQLAALYGLDRKTSEPTVVTCTCTGLAGTVIPYGAIVANDQGVKLRHTAAGGAKIDRTGKVVTPFSTIEHGAIEIGASTVTKIVTVVAGWDSVTNEAPGATGRTIEADGELYQRMLESYAINARGTVEAIQSNLAELEGVLDVVVLENPTSKAITKYSIRVEAHSIAVCIVGGEDDDIARIIFERKDAGCGTVGEHEVTHVDREHYNAVYKYRIVRPTAEDFKIKVSFFGDEVDTVTQDKIKDSLLQDYLGNGRNGRVKLATTVYASRFFNAVQSVTTAPIKAIEIGMGDDSLGSAVEVPANKMPTLSAENIELAFGE